MCQVSTDTDMQMLGAISSGLRSLFLLDEREVTPDEAKRVWARAESSSKTDASIPPHHGQGPSAQRL